MRLSSVCQRVIKTLCTSPHLQSSTDVLLGCSKAAEHPHSTRPPPAFWEPAHNNSNVCAFQDPTQRATAISFPSKSLLREHGLWFPIQKSLPKCHGHHFAMQQCKAKPIPFNKQVVATFMGLLGNAVLNVFLLTVFLLLRFSGLATNTAFYFLGWNCAAKTRTCLQKKWDISFAPY